MATPMIQDASIRNPGIIGEAPMAGMCGQVIRETVPL